MLWALIVLVVLAIPMLAILLDSPLGKALAARVGERPPVVPAPEVDTRIALLEGEVDRLSAEVERLADEAAFMTRLLAARSGDADPASPRDLPPPSAGDGASQ